jgi:hypothetical protein
LYENAHDVRLAPLTDVPAVGRPKPSHAIYLIPSGWDSVNLFSASYVYVMVVALAPQAFSDVSVRVTRCSGGITVTSATKSATERHVDTVVNGPAHPVLPVTFPVVVIWVVERLNTLVYVLVSVKGGTAEGLVTTSVADVG